MAQPVSYRTVYKEASGWKLEIEEQSTHKQYNHAVATPSNPPNPECSASDRYSPEQPKVCGSRCPADWGFWRIYDGEVNRFGISWCLLGFGIYLVISSKFRHTSSACRNTSALLADHIVSKKKKTPTISGPITEVRILAYTQSKKTDQCPNVLHQMSCIVQVHSGLSCRVIISWC